MSARGDQVEPERPEKWVKLLFESFRKTSEKKRTLKQKVIWKRVLKKSRTPWKTRPLVRRHLGRKNTTKILA